MKNRREILCCLYTNKQCQPATAYNPQTLVFLCVGRGSVQAPWQNEKAVWLNRTDQYNITGVGVCKYSNSVHDPKLSLPPHTLLLFRHQKNTVVLKSLTHRYIRAIRYTNKEGSRRIHNISLVFAVKEYGIGGGRVHKLMSKKSFLLLVRWKQITGKMI